MDWEFVFFHLVNEIIPHLPLIDRFSLIYSMGGLYTRVNKKLLTGQDIVTSKLRAHIDVDLDAFLDFMRTSNTLIGGGFMVHCMFETNWFNNRVIPFDDIDIYIGDSTHGISELLSKYQRIQTNYFITKLHAYNFTQEHWKTLNVLYLFGNRYEYNAWGKSPRKFILHHSDNSLTKCFYDGMRIWYFNIRALIYRQAQFQVDADEILYPEFPNDTTFQYIRNKFCYRCDKYANRGFQITVNNYVPMMTNLIIGIKSCIQKYKALTWRIASYYGL